MRTLFAPFALLPSGWAQDVHIDIDGHGNIADVSVHQAQGRAELAGGAVIPGMPNVHSHAFQRAMAGRTEYRRGNTDDFWSWRDAMYRFVERLGPDECQAIAAQLYVELLRAGYTAVGEFHYLNRDRDGNAYADPTELAMAHTRAAQESGIALVLMPALYGYGGLGAQPLTDEQRRFASTPDSVLRIVEVLQKHFLTERDVRFGVAPHSVRAVTLDTLNDLVRGITRLDPTAPIHMHLAEQYREVTECVDVLGARPIDWLTDHVALDSRWCLVHCTHASTGELERITRAGAVVGLCPTTEANLGDGVFDFVRFQRTRSNSAPRFGIGSDSHVSRNPADELRALEYSQRLSLHQRNVSATESQPSVGTALWQGAVAGGVTALGRKSGAIEPGMRADLLVLDLDAPDTAAADITQLLDALVFSGGDRLVKHVAVSGRWVIRDGHHRDEEAIANRYKRAVAWLTS